METNTPNMDSIQENNDLSTDSNKSFVLPLVLVLIILIIGGGYYYLNTLYPTLFKETIKRTYQAIVPSYKEENTDVNTETQEQNNNLPSPSLSPTPSPTPKHSPYPLRPDQGTAGTYKVSHNSGGGPTITNIRIDPLNAKVGSTVTITLNLTHSSAIKNIDGSVQTDETPLNFNLNKKEQTETGEVWSGQVTLTKPFLYTYIYSFKATDGQNVSTLDMALRSDQ